ncbi:hypothetical protein E5S67_05719 [Microcoleus sp. IPMA8]|uniref:Uncharacterized protein n=1 Tax=Microcoleus asticus IPMA8 TaxID=2563858 RepID=A0ABX2D710_9CYAN|nr:hypothetical protein [Microcoleus asticus IPMA8]
MLRSSIDIAESLALQLRRCKLGFPHRTPINVPRIRIAHLKRIRVYQRYQGRIRDENVRLVYVADDVTPDVEGIYSRGEISGGTVEVKIVKQRFLFAPGFGSVESVYRHHFVDARHHKTDNFFSPADSMQQIDRPSN